MKKINYINKVKDYAKNNIAIIVANTATVEQEDREISLFSDRFDDQIYWAFKDRNYSAQKIDALFEEHNSTDALLEIMTVNELKDLLQFLLFYVEEQTELLSE